MSGVTLWHDDRHASVTDAPRWHGPQACGLPKPALVILQKMAANGGGPKDALRRSEERLRAFIEQTSDGIFVADLDGRYTDVNTAGCQMLGCTREDIIGKTIMDFIRADQVARLNEDKAALLRGDLCVGDWELRRKDGTWLPVEVSAKILADG